MTRKQDAGHTPDSQTSDSQLDATSRKLLAEIREMKDLEQAKRTEARSTERFHDLAEEVADKAGDVYRLAQREELSGAADSPLREEQDEQYPGDWSRESASET